MEKKERMKLEGKIWCGTTELLKLAVKARKEKKEMRENGKF